MSHSTPISRPPLPDRGTVLNVGGTLVLIALVLPFVVTAVPQLVGASQGFVVLSSSMSPAIQAGDVVIVEDAAAAAIDEGDVITYVPPDGHQLADEKLVTHRVVEVVERDDGRYFRTKGDANEEADRALVPAASVVGRVMFHIPLIGYVIAFASTRNGVLALVIVPAALLVVNEVWSLFRAYRSSGSSSESDESTGEPEEFEEPWIWVGDQESNENFGGTTTRNEG